MAATPRIVAFAKDWDDVPTCITHVLRRMGRTMPVLWINSIGTRKPRVARPRDLRRTVARLCSGWRRAEQKENRLRVLSSVLVPKAESRVAQVLNRRVLTGLIERELKDMAAGPDNEVASAEARGRVEYWCAVPNAVDFLPLVEGGRESESPNDSRVVYYCVDDWGKFRGLDGRWLDEKERELLKRADTVFTPSRYLENKCRRTAGERVHYMSHGVDHAFFARALGSTVCVPGDVADLPRPIVGFYGNITHWVDLDLVHKLAALHPGWSFVMIGRVCCDVSRFDRVPNVHFLGRREHDQLPEYCKAFDAGMIPYDMKNARMQSVNPVKTKELLAAGVPVVAAELPELRDFGDELMRCTGGDEWSNALARQVGRTDRSAISGKVKGEDWAAKVRAMRSIVEDGS